LSGFSRPVIISTAIHEAYPGHYVQFLWLQRVESKARKLIQANSNVEGWAHYCEQMMVEQGFGGGDLNVRLAQLSEALWRDCRFVVGIKLHTGKMTYQQGSFFIKKATRRGKRRARNQARHVRSHLSGLHAGKLEILRLREDYKKQQGAGIHTERFP
jgi:uncharacterized protein (DUF885 family)